MRRSAVQRSPRGSLSFGKLAVAITFGVTVGIGWALYQSGILIAFCPDVDVPAFSCADCINDRPVVAPAANLDTQATESKSTTEDVIKALSARDKALARAVRAEADATRLSALNEELTMKFEKLSSERDSLALTLTSIVRKPPSSQIEVAQNKTQVPCAETICPPCMAEVGLSDQLKVQVNQSRELNHRVDQSEELILPSLQLDKQNPELAKTLRKIAPAGEVLVAISDGSLARPGGMLQSWLACVHQAGVTNYMVVALDDKVQEFLINTKVPYYRKLIQIPDSQKDVGKNHAISGLKFMILREFLSLGYSVLLSDVDVVTLQNPFKFLHRDSDIEALSDGWDNATAYGYDDVMDDPSMGWSRYAHTIRLLVLNSGLFYARATPNSINLLHRVNDRLAKEKAWDQQVFNEEIFFPSRPGYVDPLIRRRVMDYTLFVNSKTLFRTFRKHGLTYEKLVPVMVHVNYHSDKHRRMLAIIEYYLKHQPHALAKFSESS